MKYVIAILVLLLSIILFRKAAGNLKIKSLNIVSYIFYSLLVFDFIGITLIYLGFRDHYLIQKLFDSELTINKAYFSMVWVMLALPVVIILFNKYLFGIDSTSEEIIEKNEKKVTIEKKETNKKVYYACVISFIVCLLSTIYVFYKIGYVPLFKLLDKGFDFATERIKSGRNFAGNQYIKNLIMLLLTPFISYIAYAYMRATKSKKWRNLFVLTFILTIFVKTYDFSKAPIVYYFAYFFFIEVMLGKVKSFKKVFQYAGIVVLLVVGLYLTIGKYQGNFISLSQGPISRTVITQPGTLLLHFDAFPRKTSYLAGHSFPSYFKPMFGDGEYSIRSGRVVMQIYSPKNVENGTAGVMSTVFIGEAYANFGYYGIFIAPIIVGFIISGAYCFYLKSKKTILNMCLTLEIIILVATVVQAGFIDFIYNPSFIIIFIFTLILRIVQDKKFLHKLFVPLGENSRSYKDKSNTKRMIFHVPNYIDKNRQSGSHIRPLKMIQAFKDNGYEVDIVMGYANDRKKKINEIKRNIRNGIKYDFLYSESSTMPTLLTEKNHLPLHPLLDFSFFKYCKKNGIKIGLFYRDIHWKFDLYKNSTGSFKALIAKMFYKYDLYKYNRLVDTLYIPSESFKKHIKLNGKYDVEILPPGCNYKKYKETKRENDNNLTIFYVGGLSKDIYNIEILLDTISSMKNIKLTICCREKEWDAMYNDYKKYMSDNIFIVHNGSNNLSDFYNNADICSLFFANSMYMDMAMPIKLFEYIENYKPMIASNGTEAAKFVKEYNIGYVVNYNEKELKELLNHILKNKSELNDKVNNIKKIVGTNTWECRVQKIIKNLINKGEVKK